ncbi:MAG: hypothetical protein AB1468_06190, partial [Candidatus Micrarchaeota archaeon]
MGKKGFVLTIITILLLSLLLVFSAFYSRANQRIESNALALQPVERAGYVFDDVASDLKQICGAGISLERNASETRIYLEDALPSSASAAKFQNYKTFIEGRYANASNANITLNITNLSDGDADIIFSNGLIYNVSYFLNTIEFYNSTGSTNATSLEINLTMNKYRGSAGAWSWGASGVDVVLRYTDLNGTKTESGKLDESAPNTYTINYDGGGLVQIEFGALGGGRTGALSIKRSGSVDV